MLSNVTHSNFNFECNKERGSIDQLYIELGLKPGKLKQNKSHASKTKFKHINKQLVKILCDKKALIKYVVERNEYIIQKVCNYFTSKIIIKIMCDKRRHKDTAQLSRRRTK